MLFNIIISKFSGGTQRFNGFPGGPVGNPRYPLGPNGFGPVGPGFNGIGGQFPLNNGYGGQFPQQNGFGRPGQFGPGPIGNRPIGNGLYGSQTGGYFPGNGQTTNVLVGPGGPTGLIGRPTSGLTGQSPAVLVGPGGPTGVIGRPPGTGYGLLNTAPNGYGAYAQGLYGQAGYGQNEFAGPIGGNPNGIHQTIDIGINNGYGAGPQNAYGGIRPGGFVGPQHSGLGYPRPGSFGGPIGFGGIPYNRAGNTLAFDEPEETDKSNNKSEGKKN